MADKKKEDNFPEDAHVRSPTPPAWHKDGQSRVLPETVETLKAHGIEVPDWVEVEPYDPKTMADAIYVCRRMPKGAPPGMEGNQEGECAWCNHTIQYRPYAPKEITKVCNECAMAMATSQQ